jgi:hypothetical protein
MTTVTAVTQTSRWGRSIGVLMAVLVTAEIGVHVGKHYWRAYNAVDKFFAVVVLLLLLALPWGAIRMEKRGQKLELWHVYLIVLMVAVLFQ